ncbi:uncharacterized protein LOC123908160 [Trifolium pratense]|uniref:Uncharacterized protein n=1 Tax=Trifolium pratense TaxID=57577 RepID=A0ACB0K430_TRIPR|nr:uncharacterized protein LOC123908160 [Trifolium pratense]XP_045814661.1 uncharacterized protein LOC123908160 [Trifolium pratense]CAJ2651039.1 unnamed protein product [Trifolium pratense]
MDRVIMRQKRFKSINNCYHSDDDHAMNIRQCSNSNKSFILFSELSQDLMLDILTLLPLKCLLNSARYVSKFWAAAISAYLPLKPPGFYIFKYNSTTNSYFLNIQDHVNGKPERIALGIPSRMGHVMATCHGLLLLSTLATLTFVVNPILKCCFRIPTLPTNSRRLICVRSTIARVPRTAKFKLFVTDVLNVSGVNWYVFYVLTIGVDNTWKEIARKEAILECVFFWEPVYNGENDVYWITRDGVTVMDVDREIIIREYPLPPPRVDVAPFGVFLWMGDRLSCIVLVKGIISRTYHIYALDLDLGKWTLYHEMGPFDYGATCGHELDFDINITIMGLMFRFWINDQIFFIALTDPPENRKSFVGVTNIIFCYNVKTRQLTKPDDIVVDVFQALLHTNTLVSLPSTPT